MHYARFLSQTDSLPDGFRDTINRIAPSNAWFDIWEIHHLADGAFREDPKKRKKNEKGKTVTHYEIFDELKLEHLLSLFHQAAQKSDFSDYFLQQEERVLAELPKPGLWLEEMPYRFHTLSISQPAQPTITLGKFVSASIQHSIEIDDYKELLKLEKSSTKMAHQIHGNAEELIGALVCQAYLLNLYEQLQKGFTHFKNEELAAKYKSLHRRLAARKDRIKKAWEENSSGELIRLHGSTIVNLVSLGSRFSEESAKLTQEGLLPSCRAENAMIARLFTIGWAGLFTIFGLSLWFAAFRKRAVKDSSVRTRLAEVTASDRWRILLFGSLTPFLLFLTIRYLTPLGQLNYGGRSSGYVHLALPLSALGFLILACSLVIARRVEAPARRTSKSDLVIIIFPALAILLVGFFHPFTEAKWIIFTSAAFHLVGVIWIGCPLLLAGSAKTEKRTVIRGLLAPAFLLTAGLFGLWTFMLVKEERRWIARDQYATPSSFFTTMDEERIVKKFLSELQDYLP
ncbi:MAG: hypothetical protein ACJAQT_004082 [Akkermansiaceae bacterium]|jgi:hypothetical protein